MKPETVERHKAARAKVEMEVSRLVETGERGPVKKACQRLSGPLGYAPRTLKDIYYEYPGYWR